MTKPETKPRHPSQLPHELTASEVAARMPCERQTVLKRHERHPDRLPGRLLPHVAGLTASGRGIWVFDVSGLAVWKAERAAARKKARLIKRLEQNGIRVYRRGSK